MNEVSLNKTVTYNCLKKVVELMNIEKIVEEIKKGNLVITPTDTVYGILADATNIHAIKKVYEAKKRDYNNPFILIVANINMLQEYVSDINPLEKEIINRYLPGKLTILFKKNTKISNIITSGSEFVGIRIPDNKDLIKIIQMVGKPLISTSANIAKKATITKIKEIEPELLQNVSYVEDGGIINSTPSSIIRIENNKINVLRKGTISDEILRNYT